jgi:hypothetical protein
MSGITIQEVSYGGWERCVQLGNGIADLIVTVDVGPRIIRYGFNGKENQLCEVKADMGLTGGNEWRIYGGHRLWHSPESRFRTYSPDNSPVFWEKLPHGIKTSQETEPMTGIQKEMEITLSPDSSRISILHRLINRGPWPLELAVWSITAMATGGMEVIPNTAQDTGLLPNRCVALWPYTRMNDPRITWGDRYIIVRQDKNMRQPAKLGTANERGWAAYFNYNHLFVKRYSHDMNARYPDHGASYETYTNDFMLEMETLSPLTLTGPGSHREHTEQWELFDGVASPSENEEDIETTLGQRAAIEPC